MKISVKIRKIIISDDPLKAIASVTIDNAIAIHDIKVIEANKKVFITFPSKKNKKDDKYNNIVHPINKSVRNEIEQEVFKAYNEAYEAYIIKHADC